MNLIVGKKKPQVEVQKDEFGNREKNIKLKFKKMNLVVRKKKLRVEIFKCTNFGEI
jgi:hypothetical protein